MWYDISGTYFGYNEHNVPDYVPNVANSWRESDDHHDKWSVTRSIINDTLHSNSLLNKSGKYNWLYLDFLLTGQMKCSQFYSIFP